MPIAGYNPYAPLPLRLPSAYVGPKNNPVNRLIRTARTDHGGTTLLHNPMARKVDVWMLAIQVAVAKERTIPSSSKGLERFVDGTVLQNDPERISHLEALAISEVVRTVPQAELEVEIHRVVGEPQRVLDIANRYAAAGIEDVLSAADPSKGQALWLLADLCYELAVAAIGSEVTE